MRSTRTMMHSSLTMMLIMMT